MSRASLIFTSTIFVAAMNSALADNPRTGPRADFNIDELVIPCLEVVGFTPETEGMHFQVTLARRGKSFNYELIAAEPDEEAVCITIENFAEFIDGESDILVTCSYDDNQTNIAVKGEDLEFGQSYYAKVLAGENEETSLDEPADEAGLVEFEFEFGSDWDIEDLTPPYFISGGEGEMINAAIYLSGEDLEPVLEDTVPCIEIVEEEPQV